MSLGLGYMATLVVRHEDCISCLSVWMQCDTRLSLKIQTCQIFGCMCHRLQCKSYTSVTCLQPVIFFLKFLFEILSDFNELYLQSKGIHRIVHNRADCSCLKLKPAVPQVAPAESCPLTGTIMIGKTEQTAGQYQI